MKSSNIASKWIRAALCPNCVCKLKRTKEIAHQLEDALRAAFALRIPVETVSGKHLPRFEMKAKRWVKRQIKNAKLKTRSVFNLHFASEIMLELNNVSKNYDAVPVLRDVNFRLEAGAACAITGPSGCGKSTLFNLIGALDKPDSGSVVLNGRDLSQLSENELARVRNQEIGFVFQLHHLLPQCTALENVLIPLLAQRSIAKEQRKSRAALVGTSRVRASAPITFPANFGWRTAARGCGARLDKSAEILLADEPTGALDEKSAANLAQLLLELNREEGVALIVVTHAPDLAALLPLRYELHEGALCSNSVNPHESSTFSLA